VLSLALTVVSFLAMLASRPHLAAAPRYTPVLGAEETLV